jgi:hypothetical protein
MPAARWAARSRISPGPRRWPHRRSPMFNSSKKDSRTRPPRRRR